LGCVFPTHALMLHEWVTQREARRKSMFSVALSVTPRATTLLARASRSPRFISSTAEWYSSGLRFTCSACGKCCSGSAGFVSFSRAEGEQMAARLGISTSQFYAEYTRDAGSGARQLKEVQTAHGLDCILLERGANGAGAGKCSVYSDRPTQCKTFPFWPENIESAEAWAETKRDVPCAGMGTGKLHTLEEITTIAAEDAAATACIMNEADVTPS
jgi:Fe-S-cluster containining protein